VTKPPPFTDEELHIDAHGTQAGLTMWCARARWEYFPAGVVWTQYIGEKAAYVAWSYTLPHYRRRGVRMAIHRAMAKQYQTITTGVGSDNGGQGFLKAAGFKWDKIRGVWVWTSPDAKPLPATKPVHFGPPRPRKRRAMPRTRNRR
jgi:ribosomal protein S18 acetylase RimI-like enzyme